MATQHNFRIKNGLEVAGTVRITSAGLVTGTTTTQAASDNTTKLASTAYVTTALANLVDGAPSTLNTLNEIAAALNDDAALNTTLTTSIAAKLPLAGGTLTGDLLIPGKIRHAGDTDTYISFANNDDFRVVVGNSTRAAFNTSKIHFNQEGINQDFQVEGANVDNLLYVDASADKVGIGTSSPATGLHVVTAGGTTPFRVQGGANSGVNIMEVGFAGGGAGANFIVDDNGLVGIGITNPTQKLTLQETHANGAVKDTLRITTTGSYSSSNSEEAGAAISFGQFHNNYPTWQTGLITGIRDGNNWNGSLAFYTNTGSSETSITEKMRITGAGNIGIGVTAPNGRLQFDNGADTRKIVLYEGANNDYQFYGFGVEHQTLVYSTYLNSDDHVFFSGASTSSRNELMRIEGTGNVGIGTGSPSQKLDVNGTVELNNLTVGGAQGSDGQVLTSTGSGVGWEDVPPAATVSNTPPSSPSQGDMWFNSSTSTVSAVGRKVMAVWNGSSWKQMSSFFDATGGTESTYTSGGATYKVHTFTSSGTFTPNTVGDIDVLIVAGGGGGGAWVGSGGGAGGMIVRPGLAVQAQAYTITIGAGGARGYNPGGYSGMPYVRTGDDSTAFGLTAKGGGAGTSYSYEYASGVGGSGGGGANNSTHYPGNLANQTSQSGDSGTYGFGNNGGSAPGGSGDPYPCGGGGGAGGVGANSTATVCGNGGVGKANNYRTGSDIYYAGGGGGGHHGPWPGGVTPVYSSGGNGGGGAGQSGGSFTNAVAGTANTGGGGGGGGGSGGLASNGAAGGSGIVVVRYVV